MMKSSFLAAAMAAICLSFAPVVRAESPYSVQYAVSGYSSTETLTNFPVLVRLSVGSPVGFAYTDCASGGADLAFTDDEGKEIPREIDTWNTAGESLVWVSVPVVTNRASFTMHYGNTTAGAQPACQTDGSVWSGAGYAGVWHLTDGHDSTTNGLDGMIVAGISAAADTKLGGALDFVNSKMSVGTTPNGDMASGFSIEAWCYPRRLTDKNGDSSKNGNAFFGKNDAMSARIQGTKIRLTTPGVKDHDLIDCTIAVNQWFHLGLTFKPNPATSGTGLIANQYKVYRDGVLKGTKGASRIPNLSSSAEMWIGGNQWESQVFDGILDEFRLSYSIRSAAWIAASYATQNSADFLTAGPRIVSESPTLYGATATPSYTSAQLSVTLSKAGGDATSAQISFAYGPEGGALSAPVVLALAATDGQTLTTNLTGLAAGTAYRYVFTAVNDLPSPMSHTVEGTFSTLPPTAPTLSLSDSQESKCSQTVGATVTDLGIASSCDLYFSCGPASDPLPAYTQVGTNMTVGASFTRLLEDLEVGTVYAYSFTATNDLRLGTVETGTFTAGVGYLPTARFSYNAKFTVTGYAGTEVLTNFPVLVRLSTGSPVGFDYGDCAADGSDIRFADTEEKPLPHEIDTWNTAGESLVWVGLPVATNGMVFTMYYRSADPGASATGDVWTDYVAVIHGGSSISNSVAGGPGASAGSASVAAAADAGIIGGGIHKDVANSIGVNVADVASKLGNTGKYSVSAWFKRDGNGGNNKGTHILGASREAWNSIGIGFLWLQEQGSCIDVAANNVHQFSTGNYMLTDGVWGHAAFAYDSGVSLTTWFNGAQDNRKTSGLGDLANTSGPWTFGSYANKASDDSLKGDMDELRIYNGVASGDRIKAEYDTMANGDFLSAGVSTADVKPWLSVSALLVDADAVDVRAVIDSVGVGAASCDLYFAYAPAGDALPAWTLVASGLSDGASHTRNLTGLVEDADYDYAFMASNNLGKTIVRSGSFTPKAGIGFPRPDPAVAEFSRGVKFTVAGYTGTGVLTNFPVLVRLSANSPSGFSYADFHNPDGVPGADLCFLDSDGDGIPHEIDTWNTSGESLVWVTLPTMTNGTEFAMWYRSSKSGTTIDGGANAWADYTGVWHLNEGGDGVQTVADSTTNALDGVTHANSSVQGEGRIGASRRVSDRGGASDANGRILVSLSDADKRAAVDALAATGSDKTFTASLWLRPRGTTDYAYLIGRKENDSYGAWGAQFNSNSENKSGSFKPIRVYSAGTADSQSASVDVDATASNAWRKIDIVWTKTTYTIYYDGGSTKKWSGNLNSSNGKEPLNGSSDLAFGGTTGSGNGSLNGELDEVRLRVGSMGDDWVKADYDTVCNPAFLNGGAVVTVAETPKPIVTLRLADSGAKYAQFSGSVGICGGDATACAIHAKVWKTAESEPASWTNLVSGLGAGDAFAVAVTGLDPETAYSYKFKAVNNLEPSVDSDIVEGEFTTGSAGSVDPVVSLTGATYAGDLKIAGTYRVAWAGGGEETANVSIKWGYSANSLTHTVGVAQGAIGTGSFEITVPVDQNTIYLRAMADNGTAQGLSDEIIPIYVPEYAGVVPGDPTLPVFGTVSLSAVDGIFARVSGTVTSIGTADAGEDPITGCIVYARVGTSDNVSSMTAQADIAVVAGEPFSLAISNLTFSTTYYWCLEARNSASVTVASRIGSFTTLPEQSVANTVNADNDQRTVALSGSLAQVGAGTTDVSVRWKEGTGAWGDWTTIGTFDGSSDSTAFNASHASESWSTTIYWEVCFSNQCVTADGALAGEPRVTTQSGNFKTGDTATYTWQAADGDWNGSWTNAAHWACDKADCRDYPYGGNETIVFNDNTVATVEVPGDYSFKSLSIAKSGVNVTFVGEGAATSALRGDLAGGAMANSSWTFSAMTLAESNGIDFGKNSGSVANSTITFTDGAVGSTGNGYITLYGSNMWLVVENGASFQRTVRNGTKNGGIRLDNGTVSGSFFRTDYNWTATTNEWVVFSGAAPRLTATTSFRNESNKTEHLQNADTTFLFSVPEAGWTNAPLYATYSSTEKFGGLLGTGAGGYVIAVDPESPQIVEKGKRVSVQLVEWRSGIDTNHVRFAEPPKSVTLSWTYGWPSTLANPENEGDAPTGVKAELKSCFTMTIFMVK